MFFHFQDLRDIATLPSFLLSAPAAARVVVRLFGAVLSPPRDGLDPAPKEAFSQPFFGFDSFL